MKITQTDREGGEAFSSDVATGMSLLDYFAASAINGVLAQPGLIGEVNGNDSSSGEIARAAWRIADAMLKAKEAMQSTADEYIEKHGYDARG